MAESMAEDQLPPLEEDTNKGRPCVCINAPPIIEQDIIANTDEEIPVAVTYSQMQCREPIVIIGIQEILKIPVDPQLVVFGGKLDLWNRIDIVQKTDTIGRKFIPIEFGITESKTGSNCILIADPVDRGGGEGDVEDAISEVQSDTSSKIYLFPKCGRITRSLSLQVHGD